MRSWARIVLLLALGAFYAAACGKSQTRETEDEDGDDCRIGSERCACDMDGRCDGSLECHSGLCVDTDDDPGVGGEPSTGGFGQGGNGGGRGGTTGGTIPTGGVIGSGGVFPTGGTGGTGGTSGDGGDTGDAGEPSTGGTAGNSGGIGGRGDGGRGGGIGGAGAGGAKGGAGMGGSCGLSVAAVADTLLDDLEDMNGQIAPPRVGYWYVYTDGTCATTPPPDPTGEALFRPTAGAGQNASMGARLVGAACNTWGAGLGFDLNNCNSRSNTYNATVFSGISFWYKSTVPIRANMTTIDVIPASQGGGCTDVADMCFNPHGIDLPASPTGTSRNVPFATLSQAFGQMKAFDRTKLVNLQFQTSVTTGPWEVTIDNVSFVP